MENGSGTFASPAQYTSQVNVTNFSLIVISKNIGFDGLDGTQVTYVQIH